MWWNWAKTFRDLEAMTWVEFHDLFMGKYFLDTARHAKAQEFLELKHGTMIVLEYVARFTELARFSDEYVAKVRRLENGLKLSIWGRIVGLRLQDMDSMVRTALTIEREIEDAWSTRYTGASGKRKKSQSSSSSRKKPKASSSSGFQGCAPSSLAVRTYKEGLPPEIGILGFRDCAVPVSGGIREDTVYSSIP